MSPDPSPPVVFERGSPWRHPALDAPGPPFAVDALGGTLAPDHQSRAVFFHGRHRRTYVAYLDHHFNARVTHYDHDVGVWAFAHRVDTCIREPHPDGHNVPNLALSGDGFVHVFYGAHNHRFRYARSRRPESVDAWETGMTVGEQGTYPYFTRLPGDEMLVFYRHGPTGGYHHPFLAVQHAARHGREWGELRKLATFAEGCKLYRNNALYDLRTGRVHLVLNVPVHFRDPSRRRWGQHHCEYDPADGGLYATDGSRIGPIAHEDAFLKHRLLAPDTAILDMALDRGRLCFLLRTGGGAFEFGCRIGSTVQCIPLPIEPPSSGAPGQLCFGVGPEGGLCLFGIAPEAGSSGSSGTLLRWTRADDGAWQASSDRLLDAQRLGCLLQHVNPVINADPSGPAAIVAEPVGPWPEGWVQAPMTEYDNPSRRDRRLFAVDHAGQLL